MLKSETTDITERPSWPTRPWEVHAILDGRKTMVRRVVKPTKLSRSQELIFGTGVIKCPYGQTGEKLWVRENEWVLIGSQLMEWGEYESFNAGGYKFCADHPEKPNHERYTWVKRSSAFMPRHRSRITLEVTGVRVEKLQDITEEDAIREGVEYDQGFEAHLGEGYVGSYGWKDYTFPEKHGEVFTMETARRSFSTLWDSVNGKKYPWLENPLVWCISFKKLESHKQ